MMLSCTRRCACQPLSYPCYLAMFCLTHKNFGRFTDESESHSVYCYMLHVTSRGYTDSQHACTAYIHGGSKNCISGGCILVCPHGGAPWWNGCLITITNRLCTRRRTRWRGSVNHTTNRMLPCTGSSSIHVSRASSRVLSCNEANILVTHTMCKA